MTANKFKDDFVVFIVSHGRSDRVKTYSTLKRDGYTGKIFIVIDDTDKQQDEYKNKYGDEVIIFNKRKAAEKFDRGDNFEDFRVVVYARNACFEIAEKLGLKYFLVLDDDYHCFQYRFNQNNSYEPRAIKNLDLVFKNILEFLENTKTKSIAMSQGGDFIGGSENKYAETITLTRKCMNSFFCSTSRPFEFCGTINEDVNTYVLFGSRGDLFFTMNQLSLEQTVTQSNSDGMTTIYLDKGTYIKSFYSVLFQPSSVKVIDMGDRNGRRLHHSVNWKYCVPKILRESVKR